MSGLVLDASMALAWIFEREAKPEQVRAERALRQLADTAASVPSHWHSEVLNAVLVGERRKVVTPAQVADYLARLASLDIVVDDAAPWTHSDAVLATARQYGLTAYDAAYLELALRTGAALGSFDKALLKAAATAGVETV